MIGTGLALACFAFAAPGDVEVRPVAGPPLVGRLVGVEAGAFVVEGAEGRRTFPLAQTLAVRRRDPSPVAPNPGTVAVTLVDGSTASATRFVVEDGTARIRLAGGDELTTLVRSIAHVRFGSGPADEALDRRWSEIVEAERSGDLVVVRKVNTIADEDGAERTSMSLDYFEGVVSGVSDEAVSFTFSERDVEVKREKLEGLAWYRPAGRELPDPIASIVTDAGDRFAVRDLRSEGDDLEMTLVSGAKHSTSLDGIREFDFSGGKIVYLSDLTPESIEYQPYLAIDDPASAAAYAKLFRPRMDRAIAGPQIRLFEQTFSKGVVAPSKTVLTYRLPARYRRLQATVGIDDSVRNRLSRASLTVQADGETLYTGEFSGGDAEATPIDLDISGARRLTFTIDYADKSDAGDHLALGDLRAIQ